MRKIPVIIATFLAMVMLFTACGTNTASQSSNTNDKSASTTSTVEYASKLFDNSYVHTINVEISEEDWEDLTANPLQKTKYDVNVTIDGETVNNVSFATKGNTSLSSIASDSDSDRYSFKINFGKYVDGQTYYGLNKLSLSNIYADATYMKDYLSYEIFREAGVESPLTSYVSLSINGELAGLYLAIEDVSESYLERTANGEGVLYKPETDSLANMNNVGDFDPDNMELPEGMENFDPSNMEMPEGMENFDPSNMEMPTGDNVPQNGTFPSDNSNTNSGDTSAEPSIDASVTQPINGETQTSADGETQNNTQGGMEAPGNNGNFDPSNMDLPEGMENFDPSNMELPEGMQMPGNMGGMSFGSDSNGADLKYTDDELSSYSDIFNNAETNADEDDNKRVITALKGLSESSGSDLENYINTDEVIRYFVAHNFVMNYDSYTGTMLHNYYLYENNGILSMLPWDYNLAFGAFMGAGGGQQGEKQTFEMPQNVASEATQNGTGESEVNTNTETPAAMPNTTGNGGQPSEDNRIDNTSQMATNNATEIINYDIDAPLSGATEEDRPMWSWIVDNEEYLEKYHEVFDSLITNYFESGKFETEMERVYNMIRPYVEDDPSAFYTVDEFDAAHDTLLEFCKLRAESIRKQLNGEEANVDASSININTMGSQSQNEGGDMGGFGGGMTFPNAGNGNTPGGMTFPSGESGNETGGMTPPTGNGNTPGGMTPPTGNGTTTETTTSPGEETNN